MRFSFEQTNQCHRIHGGNPSTEEELKNAIRDEWNISSYDPNIMEEFRVSGMTETGYPGIYRPSPSSARGTIPISIRMHGKRLPVFYP